MEMRHVADSLASTSHINDALLDVSGNSAAMVTCLGELQATTANLVAEVKSLAEAVQGNTAAIEAEGWQTQLVQAETDAILTRIAVALEGRQPARERPGDAPPDAPPPRPEAPTRQLRSQGP